MNAEIFGKVFFAGWQAAKEGFPYDRRSIDFTGEGCDEKRPIPDSVSGRRF